MAHVESQRPSVNGTASVGRSYLCVDRATPYRETGETAIVRTKGTQYVDMQEGRKEAIKAIREAFNG